jgi:hypothetical protein
MNTTTLALAAAGVYFLTRPKATADTAGTGAMDTGAANAGGTGADVGMSFATLQGMGVPGTYAAFKAAGFDSITGKFDGIVSLDADQIAALGTLIASFGVKAPRVSIGKWGDKALPKTNIGKITLKLFDASAGANNTTQKRLSGGIRGISEITVEHRKDSGIVGAFNDAAKAGAQAAGNYVESTLTSLLPK